MAGPVRWTLLALAFCLCHITFVRSQTQKCPSDSIPVSVKALNFTPQAGHCTWYGQCVTNQQTTKPFNCYYNGEAHDPTDDKKLMNLLNSTCPWLVNNVTSPRVCCDLNQLEALADQTSVARSLFSRCPACFNNFMKHFCYTTCDPNQSLYMDPTNYLEGTTNAKICTIDGKNLTYLSQVTVYYKNSYGEKLYGSCENVAYPEQSGRVMDLMCGTNKCNSSKWLAFLGNPALDYNQAPFPMIYDRTSHIPHPGMGYLDLPILNCYDDGQYKCSCTDCPKVCPPLPVIPESSPWELIEYSAVMAGCGFLLSLFVSVSCWIYACFTWKYQDDDDDDFHSSVGSGVSINADSPNEEDKKDKNACPVCYGTSVLGAWFEFSVKSIFYRWGVFASKYWFLVIPACILVAGAFSSGMVFFNVTTDPVKLWSAPKSTALQEKNYFDKNFSPFYRTEQVIVTVKPGKATPYRIVKGYTNYAVGPVFNKDILLETFYLQQSIQELAAPFTNEKGKQEQVRLTDICFSPLSPDNDACTIESVFNYFQNNLTRLLFEEGDFFDTYNATFHINYCTKNPTATLDNTDAKEADHQIPCLGAYGGPIDPNTALGGFNGTDFMTAEALLMTFVVRNHVDEADNKRAEAWEKVFLDFMKNYTSEIISVSYMAERAITDEINRESRTDVVTIFISYVVMFLYIAVFLGHIRSLSTIFIDLKLLLGLFGVFIVLLAVLSSIGCLSFMKVEASLIILEVVPFLVLAVGVDNLFILVHSYEREHRKASTLPVNILVGRALAEVAPSLLLTATSESAAFLLGAISSMPAVRSFSLYAGVAVFFNFLLQITAFISVMALDARRQSSFRLDVLCCLKMNKSDLPDVRNKSSLLFLFMKKIWTKYVVLHPLTRPLWLLVFGLTFFGSMAAIPWTEIGLDQRLALPKDSYLQKYFSDMNTYLHIGPPVYFVIRDGFDYTTIENQNLICSGSDCANNSMGTQITIASRISNYTRIAETPSIWLDAYFEWLDPTSTCCGHAPNDPNKRCDDPDEGQNSTCVHCLPPGESRPNKAEFLENLEHFFTANPTTSCAAAGHAAYNSAVAIDYKQMKIGASYVMTFHTILRNSSDYIAALKQARALSVNLSRELDHPVFPYSVFYVYYDQYLHIVMDMVLNIGVSLGAVFLVTICMLGFNVWGAFMIISVVFMILVHMGGVMSFANINANAVSLVNLVMTVGIAVEFCSHIVRWFISDKHGSRLKRAQSALANMGSSVVSGITCTKFLGVFILFFAKSQLFEVYYFRMYVSMVFIGAAHGLIFLPVLLSYIGPSYYNIKTNRPYPKDPSERSNDGSPIEEDDKYKDEEKHPKGLYPTLPTNVNDIDPYQGYGAPTYPSERTPLMS